MEAMHSQTLASKDSSSTSTLVMNFEGDNIDIVNFENDQDIASYMESGNVEYIEEDPVRVQMVNINSFKRFLLLLNTISSKATKLTWKNCLDQIGRIRVKHTV